jgi:hypothetical protein
LKNKKSVVKITKLAIIHDVNNAKATFGNSISENPAT